MDGRGVETLCRRRLFPHYERVSTIALDKLELMPCWKKALDDSSDCWDTINFEPGAQSILEWSEKGTTRVLANSQLVKILAVVHCGSFKYGPFPVSVSFIVVFSWLRLVENCFTMSQMGFEPRTSWAGKRLLYQLSHYCSPTSSYFNLADSSFITSVIYFLPHLWKIGWLCPKLHSLALLLHFWRKINIVVALQMTRSTLHRLSERKKIID